MLRPLQVEALPSAGPRRSSWQQTSSVACAAPALVTASSTSTWSCSGGGGPASLAVGSAAPAQQALRACGKPRVPFWRSPAVCYCGVAPTRLPHTLETLRHSCERPSPNPTPTPPLSQLWLRPGLPCQRRLWRRRRWRRRGRRRWQRQRRAARLRLTQAPAASWCVRCSCYQLNRSRRTLWGAEAHGTSTLLQESACCKTQDGPHSRLAQGVGGRLLRLACNNKVRQSEGSLANECALSSRIRGQKGRRVPGAFGTGCRADSSKSMRRDEKRAGGAINPRAAQSGPGRGVLTEPVEAAPPNMARLGPIVVQLCSVCFAGSARCGC